MKTNLIKDVITSMHVSKVQTGVSQDELPLSNGINEGLAAANGPLQAQTKRSATLKPTSKGLLILLVC